MMNATCRIQNWNLNITQLITEAILNILTTWSQQLFRCLECTIREETRWTASGLSTLGSVHAPHGKHGPNGGFAGPGTGTLKQGPALRQEVILHPLHQQPLALHTVPEQRVGLQICQKLHTQTRTVVRQQNRLNGLFFKYNKDNLVFTSSTRSAVLRH